jgi:nitrite reductase/ring-hydroxylating ferredoxin subunit
VHHGDLNHRVRSTAYVGDALEKAGVPIVVPVGAHAVYLDARRLLPHIPSLHYPRQSLAIELYREGGVRGCEIGTVMFGRQPDGSERPAHHDLVRLAVPRRVYTQSHMDYVVEVVTRVAAASPRVTWLSDRRGATLAAPLHGALRGPLIARFVPRRCQTFAFGVESATMRRRDVLVLGGATAMGVGPGCALLRGGASHPTISQAPTNGIVRVKKSAIPPDEALELNPGKPYREILIASLSSGGYAAVDAHCSHKDCIVDWNKAASEWPCPCHGSRYAVDGKVLEGPATAPIRALNIKDEGDELIIELGPLPAG